MLKNIFLVLSLISFLNADYALANRSCKGEVARAKSTLNRALNIERRFENQVRRFEERILNVQQQMEMALAQLRAKEEMAKADRNMTTARCVIEATLTGRFCPPSGRNCVTNRAQCGLLLAALEQQVQRFTSQRQARQRTFENRIKVLQGNLDRAKKALEDANKAINKAQAKFDNLSKECDEESQEQACLSREETQCRRELRICNTENSACNREVNTLCRQEPADKRSQCYRDGYAQCKEQLKTCRNVNCMEKAKKACGVA